MKSNSKKSKTGKSKAGLPVSQEINLTIHPESEQQDITSIDSLASEGLADQLQLSKRSNKKNKALIDAILELEREDEIQATLLGNYIEQMKRLVHQLETVLHSERSSHAKILLYRHLLPDTDWVEILTDERMNAWHAEAASRAKLFEKL